MKIEDTSIDGRSLPELTLTDLENLRSFAKLPATASYIAILREWARNWWYNHLINFRDGNPMEAVPELSEAKLAAVAAFYESDYRDPNDRRK
jgi:hypothetical protein